MRARGTDEMRRVTSACHGCYRIYSVLAIKINIAFEIKINSSALGDKKKAPPSSKLFLKLTNKGR